MDLSNVPSWFWIGAAIVGFLYASRNGWLKAPDATPAASAKPAQVVELRHTIAGSEASAVVAGEPQDLTEVRRVGFEFDVAVTPRPKPKGPA